LIAIVGVETENDAPPKPKNPEKCVGIDVGILKYAHDSDGTAVEGPDLSEERERLGGRTQRDLSRKQHGSANYRKQQRVVAGRHADLKRKRRDFLHKHSAYYAWKYDLVAVEDLDAKRLMELPSNSRNRAGAAWRTFLRMLECKCERERTHYVAVDPRGTTKECSNRGVATEKPLWVREHSYPSCGFEEDRDLNVAYNILSRGLDQVGSGSLRFNACGDCALCGNQFDSCKAHPRNRKPRPQRGHKAEQGGIVHSRTTVIPMTETIPRATVTRRPSCWVPISHASPALVSVFAIAPITIPVVATSGEIVPSAASRFQCECDRVDIRETGKNAVA